MKKVYIFDLDGTLVDAYYAIYRSLNFTLTKLGYKEVSYFRVKKAVGRGDELFIKSFFPLEVFKKALSLYRKHHKKTLLNYVKLKPYAKNVLYLLKRKKKLIAIASNRPTFFSKIILRKLFLNKYIHYLLCADRLSKLKPHPEILFKIMEKLKVSKEEVVFVGDMDIDMETAKRAGVDSIFLKGGSSSLKEVKNKFNGVKIANSLKDVLEAYE